MVRLYINIIVLLQTVGMSQYKNLNKSPFLTVRKNKRRMAQKNTHIMLTTISNEQIKNLKCQETIICS